MGGRSDPCVAVKPSAHIRWIEEKVRRKTPNLILKQEGSDAGRGDAPWHVSISALIKITEGYKIVCQGAILSERWILTAASCVDDDPIDIMVEAGRNGGNKQTEYTIRRFKHKDYKVNDKYDKHNIALIFLNNDLNFDGDYVKPIQFLTVYPAEDCKVFGWEYNYETKPNAYENPLQVRQVEIIDSKRCISPMLKPKALQFFLSSRHHICTEQEHGRPTISVEAGTALICKGRNNQDYGIFGVASFGGHWERVGGGAGPKTFTSIAENLTWITGKQKEIEKPPRPTRKKYQKIKKADK